MDDPDAPAADDLYAPARDALAGARVSAATPPIPIPRSSPLASTTTTRSRFADRYQVPDGVLYMDGNSLGPASDAALASLDRVVDEWRDLLIAGWTDADPPWFEVGSGSATRSRRSSAPSRAKSSSATRSR